MPIRRLSLGVLLFVGCFLAPASAARQEERVTGLVTDSLVGTPIREARVLVVSDDGGVAGRGETDARGEFRIPLRPGTYTFRVTFVGHAPWQAGQIQVPQKNGEILQARLLRRPAMLGTISYRLPWIRQFTFTVSVDNLLDRRHREFVGAPVLGRLLLGRVKVEF